MRHQLIDTRSINRFADAFVGAFVLAICGALLIRAAEKVLGVRL